ncbi:protein bassoon [Psammomys obesus]|uniref:protein bassoon n=1 Tax=Psammomys obesus TaxID=48139 RepID=UPI002452E460|nr:protein bassoon [Psammomys obesus]
MGNEASLEGGAGEGPLPPGGSGQGPGPGAGKPPSALAGGGQLPAAAAARATAPPAPGLGPIPGPGPGPGPGPSSVSRRLDPKEPLGSQRATSPTPKQASAPAPGRESPRETRAQGPSGQEADGPRRTLQVDSRTQRSGRSPSVSPDRGSTPTSPYSVPQIAPLPSSTLCPICKTSDLTSASSQPNFNTCTQCHNKVCNQCGFNPNPHLTQVKEWLCLNCQMQRALGMDMTTAPRSKSQQQLHSPALSPAHSPAKQPLGKPEQERSRGPGATQSGPRQAETARATSVPGPTQATAPSEVGRVSPQPSLSTKPSTAEPRPPAGEAQSKSATTVPPGLGAGEQTQEGLTGKLFGLGASLLTQASTLMSVQPEADTQGQPSPSKGPPKIVFSDASKEAGPRAPGSGPGPGPTPGAKTEPGARTGPGSGPGALAKTGGTASPKHGRAEHQAAPKAAAKPKTTPKERAACPLCQAELNVGGKGPANYNTCTSCRLQVCNLCGFNPAPHLVEKSEWLCLNCQTKRLLEGGLGEPAPLPLPTSQQPPAGVPHRAAGAAPLKQKGPQGLGQPSGSLPAKASPQATKASPQATKASPQAKPLRASEPSKTSSSAQEKKTGTPAKAEQKPPAETTVPPGTPKAKSGVKRTEPATPVTKPVPEAPKGGEAEEPASKPYSQDLSRSPQSLSDTGYSSDGVSSSQSEITGVVQHDAEQLDSAGVTGPRPPSPSELHKVGSSMRPSLEAQAGAPGGEWSKPPRGSAPEDQKRRPHSLSIMPEAFDSDEELQDILEEEEASLAWGRRREPQDTAESSDDLGSQLRHDYVEDSSEGGLSPLPPQPPARAGMTDEEFMRRQILEMSAEEDNLEEEDAAVSGRGPAKQKGGARPRPESSQEPPRRRLPHNATTGYEELLAEGGPAEPDGGALQGGLRRFKTIELNSTGGYGHELDLGQGPDASLDREPELEMESLTGSPEDRSRGEHSSTLPASTPSYTSGASPTSLSSLEEDSDSSPSRRQRLEEAKQQRKARHRSHGPLLPTIEDSSEEEELREEEELLREQEKMREVEQQRIRSTARKTRRDKEELRAQRRRERSKTPPSNLSPIEDASPTEELRQAAEMEELHRSSCSEYSPSPSLDSEAEAPDGGPARLYKSGSEYNLPAFTTLYSPTEAPTGGAAAPSAGRPLKSAEEAYEDMMRKAELLQRQQGQAAGARGPFDYQDPREHGYGRAPPPAEGPPAGPGAAYADGLPPQAPARTRQASPRDLALAEDKKKEAQFLNADSVFLDPMRQNGGPLTPGTSPTQLAAPVSFSASTTSDGSGGRVIPDVRVTQHFAKEPQEPVKLHSSPVSPGLASKEVGVTFAQGPGPPATTAVAPCPASLPRGYVTAAPPAGAEHGPSPSSTAHSRGQPPTTANYGSQTEEPPPAPGGPAASGRASREKPLSGGDAEAGAPQPPRGYSYFTGSSPPLSPATPSESPTFSPGKLGPRPTAEFSTQTPSPTPPSDIPRSPGAPSPMVAQGTQTPHRPSTPRLVWQQSSQEAPVMVITLASDASSQTGMVHASASTSPLCSPTGPQPASHSYSQTTPPSAPQMPPEPAGPPGFPRAPSAGADAPLALYGWGALPAENISLCRISSVPGTSRVEPGPRPPGSAVVDLRTAVKPTPIILTDQGMDLTSLAVEARKYGLALDPVPGRQSTAVQPLVINLNAQEQTHTFLATATTVSLTMASSVLMAQQKQPAVYGDPFQSRLDFGQGSGSPVCLAQVKQVEQAVQTAPYRGGPRGRPREAKFARYNLPNQVTPLARRDILITQMGAAQSVSLKPGPVPEPGAEPHRATPAELRPPAPPGARKPHAVVVQMGEGAAGTVTTLVPEEPAGALDLTGMRPESQLACCDMVSKFPFGSSCAGTFHPAPGAPDKTVADAAPPGQSSGPFYSPRDPEPPEPLTFRAQGVVGPGSHEEQRPYPQGLPGRLYSSMSDTNLAEAGLNYHAHRIGQLFQGPGRDAAVDLSSLKHSYSLGFADGRYLGQGLQYGSFTDLRHPTDLLAHPLPMRRYSSVSNIYSDHRYGPRGDAVGFQEASLAQYSATTAREISRMCAALNSMDQHGGRHGGGGPDLVQYQPPHGPGLSAPQGLAPLRSGLLGNPTYPEGQPSPGNLAQYGPAASQGTAVRQLLPSTATVRAADGMIYSTINTPIAATLPITTQPASVLRPLVRGGVYRPYVSGGVTAVPLSSLTRVPVIAPRVPLGPAGLYRYPAPRFPVAASIPPAEGPVYLGKPAAAKAAGTGPPPRPEPPAGAAHSRSRRSGDTDAGPDGKHDAGAPAAAAAAARAVSSVGIQTISDCSVQTEPEQLPRVSPAIHITAATDPKVEIVRYISAPEKTGRGESLACQTEPDGQAQGVAGPQLVGPTAISPYLPGIQIVSPGPLGRFEKKKPDPLEIGYQAHLPVESLSQLVGRQPPKSPQVLYSPVSPLSPHRLLDTSFASSERLNKAHVSPQKHFLADSALHQQTLPRPMKTLQRSLSDPKPLSPTAEESAKERFSLYQHQGGLGSQVSALPPNGLVRKVKRTLPSPPPEEAHLPLAGQVPSQLYAASLLQRGLAGPTTVPATKASLLRELDRDLRLVEHESTKLRKKQAELDEEEKEIDAKLKYLELGITQRKESLAKDRGGRDYPPLRGLGEHRDYLSDSELNQLRLQGCATPAGQYADYPASAAVPATPSGPAAFQQPQPPRFPPAAPQYSAGASGPTQNGFPAHQAPTYTGPSTYPASAFPPGTSYPAEAGLPSQQAFHPTGHYAAPAPMPTTQSTHFPIQADSRAPHQKPRQASLADLEQKVPTNYEVISSPAVTVSSAPSDTSYSGPAVSSSYEPGKGPEHPRGSDRGAVSQSPAPAYPSDSHYTSLEQNVPRNYVMIDDISELTKDSAPAAPESQRLEPLGPGGVGARPGKEPGEPAGLEGPALPCCYGRAEEESEEDSYDPRGKAGHHRSMESNGRPASTPYYGDSDYRHGARADKYGPGPVGPKHPSKSLAPAAIPSKRSKHRKQGLEQKISKFSPIEEAKDVESDLASYPSPAVSSSLTSRGRKFQDEITYGLKKNVYEQQRYYGASSRDLVEEDERVYGGGGRSRVASAYSGEKLSSHDFGSRGKGYEREREAMERLQKAGPKPSSLSMAHGRARPPMRSQASEEESPVSPLGRPRPAGGALPPGDTCPQFCSSHSMPDVQEHVKDGPRAHAYKREEGYILDDSHCVVSDSEAYHLGQEETDWFDKPREARSDRFRHHGGHAVSSSQKRGPARHSHHDYDEPPEEGLWPHDEGGPSRHTSAKEHRHHGDHGRHSGRHAGEEPGRRAAKPHPRDMGRHETRPHPQASPAPAMQKKGQPGYPSSADYSQPSRAPSSYHHASDSKKGPRQAHSGPALQPKPEAQAQPQMQGRQAAPGPQQPPSSRQTPSGAASRQPQPQQQQQQLPQQQQQQQQQQGLGQQAPQQAPPSQARLQQQSQPATRGSAPAASQPAGKPQPGPTTAPGAQPAGLPRAEQASASKAAAKAPQQGRAPQAQPTPGPGPAGVKPGARPGGTPGAPAGQPGAEGESVFSKILPGGAAEQAGKLTEAVSAFGKKFSSFW